MEDLVNLIMNSGVTIVVLAYFMFINYRFMGKLENTLQVLVDTVDSLNNTVKAKEDNTNGS